MRINRPEETLAGAMVVTGKLEVEEGEGRDDPLWKRVTTQQLSVRLYEDLPTLRYGGTMYMYIYTCSLLVKRVPH